MVQEMRTPLFNSIIASELVNKKALSHSKQVMGESFKSDSQCYFSAKKLKSVNTKSYYFHSLLPAGIPSRISLVFQLTVKNTFPGIKSVKYPL